MLDKYQVPIIAFVWRPEEILPSVTGMAHRTASRAIFDFSMLETEALHSVLQKADPACRIEDIKISASSFMDPSLGPLLKEKGVLNIWVECHPQYLAGDISGFMQRLGELSKNHRCFPIVTDMDILTAILKDSSGIGHVVLKGCEASGFVSGETTQLLYSTAKQLLRRFGKVSGCSHLGRCLDA